MDALTDWILGDGIFITWLTRMCVLVFSLQFVTGLAYILRGAVDSTWR